MNLEWLLKYLSTDNGVCLYRLWPAWITITTTLLGCWSVTLLQELFPSLLKHRQDGLLILFDLQSGDIVLADKSFDIVDTLSLLQWSLKILAFTRVTGLPDMWRTQKTLQVSESFQSKFLILHCTFPLTVQERLYWTQISRVRFVWSDCSDSDSDSDSILNFSYCL